MIVPMKKVSLVVLDSERKEALKKLRKLGLVHLEQVQGSGERLSKHKSNFTVLESAFMTLSDIKVPKAKKSVPTSVNPELDAVSSLAKAEEINDLILQKKNLEDKIVVSVSEIDRLASWGGVTPADFTFLSQKGIDLSLYEIPNDAYLSIPEDVETLFVNRDKGQTRFLVIGNNGKRPESLPADAFSISLPSVGTEELAQNIIQFRKDIVKIEAQIENSIPFKTALKKAMSVMEKEIEFENLYTGIGKEEDSSVPLAWLTGYLPSEDLGKLQKLAQEENWALATSDPAEEDEVPTKLKNNKFVSLIYPVSDFLGTVPGYREYDISGWFLLFFCIFFGMIFGDAGYGLLMVLAATAGIISSASKKKPVGPAMYLLMLLGVTTVAWGTITCTWFGLAPDALPTFIRSMSFGPLSNAVSVMSPEKELWVKQNMQVFCFGLALVQLTIAHIKGIVRNIKSLKAFGEIGSMLMLWGIFYLVLNMVVDGTRFSFDAVMFGIPLIKIVLGLVATGFALNFIFSNYDGSVLRSILESCKNIVSVLLGVVNIFSDIVSYIRLWAVGLAGSAISATVNQMAGPTLGGALIFAGILLLCFGHGLNMILNVLSVIVHGVRLNTLEFSSHLGMSWSGFNYQPFNEGAKK